MQNPNPAQGNAYRWHCHPLASLRDSKDDIHGHMERVQTTCLDICKAICFVASDNLLIASVQHDLPELIMGDWPYTLTRDYCIARVAKRILEWQIKRKMGLKWRLTRQEKLILALADKLDAIEWARARITEYEFAQYFLGDVNTARGMAAKLGPSVTAWLDWRLRDKGVMVWQTRNDTASARS